MLLFPACSKTNQFKNIRNCEKLNEQNIVIGNEIGNINYFISGTCNECVFETYRFEDFICFERLDTLYNINIYVLTDNHDYFKKMLYPEMTSKFNVYLDSMNEFFTQNKLNYDCLGNVIVTDQNSNICFKGDISFFKHSY